MIKKKHIGYLFTGVLVSAILYAGASYAYWSVFNYRFTPVTEGRFYQSAEMPPEKLQEVVQKFKIRAVIDLRKPAEKVEAERVALAQVGVEHFHLPTGQVPSDEVVEKYLTILDEPTNGLDPAGMKEVRDLIMKLGSEGKTIFLNSHLLHEVEQVCDHVGIINKGKMIAIGPPKDLMKKGDTIQIRASETEKALSLLSKVEWISSVSKEDEWIILKMPADRGIDISRLLAKEEVYIAEMKVKEDSLENFFLKLTEEDTID